MYSGSYEAPADNRRRRLIRVDDQGGQGEKVRGLQPCHQSGVKTSARGVGSDQEVKSHGSPLPESIVNNGLVMALRSLNMLKGKRALKLSYRVLIVATIIIFIVGISNLLFFLGGLTGSSFSPKLSQDENTGDWTMAFNGNPRNGGFLDVTLFFEITILDINERVITTNSTTVLVKAGSSQPFSLVLRIPADMVPGGKMEEARGYFQMRMTIGELGNLMGLTQLMKIGGGD